MAVQINAHKRAQTLRGRQKWQSMIDVVFEQIVSVLLKTIDFFKPIFYTLVLGQSQLFEWGATYKAILWSQMGLFVFSNIGTHIRLTSISLSGEISNIL